MAFTKPKVGIFFCGGGSLFLERRKRFIVQKESQIQQWLALHPELGIMAELETHFVCDEEEAVGGNVKIWQEAAKQVWEKRPQMQGAVVLYPTSQLSFAAAGLDVMLQRLDMPVILTGDHVPQSKTEARRSSAYHTLGAKANLIGAVHTATRDLAGAALLYDAAVLRADDATREAAPAGEMFASFSGKPLGSVGLGVLLEDDRVRRADVRNPVFAPQLASSVGVVQWLPGVDESLLLAQAKAARDGVIVRVEAEELGEAPLRKFLHRLGDLPAFVYARKVGAEIADLPGIVGVPFETALARVMASLGRGVQLSTI